jgi:hypothetical protein
MDQTPPPPDDRRDRLLSDTQALLTWLVGEITARLAAGGGLKVLRWTLRHLITPAEALMRRALRLLAERLPAPEPAAPTRRPLPSRPAIRTAAGAGPRRPVFRLNEARPGARGAWLPVSQRPRISIAGLAPPPPPPAPRAPVDEAAFAARLARRLAALEAALADPRPLARRLLRLRMKRSGPRATLSYFRPPGLHARPLGPERMEVFKALNDIAMRFELAQPDSS